ncbi:MAG: outer membrane protein assembly factor BamD [Bacteriovoracaceae bacterium]|nr:outer membrane protein assembly factor BamD [Bacteriovoracaceae bacterium]
MKKLILLCLLFVFSCATDAPEGKTEAEILYKEAQQLVEDGSYILALEKLNKLRSEHPYSFYATPAELLQADIFFLQESYVEAAASYLLFRDLHPRHDKADYVIYKIAESYYLQIPDTYDRDLNSALEAIKYYDEILQKYPSSEYAKDTQVKIDYCRNMLRQKERYIADFYFKTKVYEAARYRYLEIIKAINEEGLRKHSMVRAVESSLKMKDYEGCVKFSEEFVRYVTGKDKESIEGNKSECAKELAKSNKG